MSLLTTTFHAWSRLPTELKLEIISYLFLRLDHISYIARPVDEHRANGQGAYWWGPTLGRLVGTRNTELANLALETFYNANKFSVVLGGRGPGIARPKAFCAPWIRRLKVYVLWNGVGESLEEMLLDPVQGWRWLLRPKRALDAEVLGDKFSASEKSSIPDPVRNTQWQCDFTGLKYLELVLLGSLSNRSCLERAGEIGGLKQQLEQTEILLQANVVKVLFSLHIECEPWSPICACKQEIAVLEEMMVRSGERRQR